MYVCSTCRERGHAGTCIGKLLDLYFMKSRKGETPVRECKMFHQHSNTDQEAKNCVQTLPPVLYAMTPVSSQSAVCIYCSACSKARMSRPQCCTGSAGSLSHNEDFRTCDRKTLVISPIPCCCQCLDPPHKETASNVTWCVLVPRFLYSLQCSSSLF